MSIVATDAITADKPRICQGYEPITGYKLEKLIGRGGFGEVWLSEAPGGLRKAVKFVFGSTDQQQAVRELRSLERIKGVHHPFLLTLERFGIIDDRLVIVTELADGSLEDVYRRHIERGSCGIPRVSLLSYMHDAADALDYLHREYQLQHLDIKPGNLLLVGGHVKVGDFGLLKDLREIDCSIVGGLTPVYAPPELFDGRPSMHSDQYSLAVMYQELLTGVRPFGGRTIAQLATQHVHSAPNLNPLPAPDRPLIAKALEKDPQRRFANCCELIDALRAASSRMSRGGGDEASVVGGDTLTGVLREKIGMWQPSVKDLPQVKVPVPRGGVRITNHALVIAIGGAGSMVLHNLRDRVASQHAACPLDLHAILIDTDATTIQAARLSEVSDRVPVCQSLHTPLKTAQHYREYKGTKYKSISRRWLYNIPRSCATEAMRPLGRLALIDHGDDVCRQLEESIGHLGAVAGSAVPSVYVVSSIDGGTGSGMVLDIVHLVRSILDRCGMAQVSVMPILMTGAMNRETSRGLAGADAAATLAEMIYFTKPGNGYPGDAAADWPTVPSARTPLVDAYVIASGPASQNVAEPTETAAEYIWVNSSVAREFLEAARQDASDDSIVAISNQPRTRSIGIVRLRSPRLLEENLLAPSIVRQLMFQWLGDPAEAKELALALMDKLEKRSGLTTEFLIKHCLGKCPGDHGKRLEMMRSAVQALPSSVRNDPEAMQQAIRSLIINRVGVGVQPMLSSAVAKLTREISVRLLDTRCDLALAIELLVRWIDRLKKNLEVATTGQTEWITFVNDADVSETSSIEEMAEQWLGNLIRCNTAEAFGQTIDVLGELLGQIQDRAAVLAQCVRLISQSLDGDDDEILRHVDEGVRVRLSPVLGTLRNQVSHSVIGLQSMARDHAPLECEGLIASLLDRALPLISTAMTWGDDAQEPHHHAKPLDGDRTANTNPAGEKVVRWDDPAIIAQAIRSVKPALLACGGCQRMLLIVGSELERSALEPKIREVHNGTLTTAIFPGSAAMLICEAQQINLTDVQSRIITVNGNSNDVMIRLAARNDIDWKWHPVVQ